MRSVPATSPALDPAGRPQRADARRNQAKVLQAARDEFAACGPSAQMPDIARRAGVGVGTVYRHFPTKDALAEALARDHFARLADDAEAAVAREGDAWEILVTLLHACAARCAEDRGLAAAVGSSPDALAVAAQEQTRLHEATSTLTDRARARGQMREDATIDDVSMIMCSVAHVAEMERAGHPGFSWRRHLEVSLDGMRAR
jgi:AcrR family transcriptional regulator